MSPGFPPGFFKLFHNFPGKTPRGSLKATMFPKRGTVKTLFVAFKLFKTLPSFQIPKTPKKGKPFFYTQKVPLSLEFGFLKFFLTLLCFSKTFLNLFLTFLTPTGTCKVPSLFPYNQRFQPFFLHPIFFSIFPPSYNRELSGTAR